MLTLVHFCSWMTLQNTQAWHKIVFCCQSTFRSGVRGRMVLMSGSISETEMVAEVHFNMVPDMTHADFKAIIKKV